MISIWTWNVNSIRNKVDKVQKLLRLHDIDILVITETKIQQKLENQIEKSLNISDDYSIIWSSNQNSYHHGIAMIYKKYLQLEVVCKHLPLTVKTVNKTKTKNSKWLLPALADHNGMKEHIKLAHWTEGRIIVAWSKTKHFIVVGTYVPNSGIRQNKFRRLAYRTQYWDKDLQNFLNLLTEKYQKVIWVGDMNVARRDCDMYKKGCNFAGTTPEERQSMNEWLEEGWIDTWDYLRHDENDILKRCTFGVETTRKLRLDYVIVSKQLKGCIKNSFVLHDYQGSDHVPMGTLFDL